MKVEIDKEICIGCGCCVSICPQVFRMDETEHAEVYSDTAAETEDAMASCPVNAITKE